MHPDPSDGDGDCREPPGAVRAYTGHRPGPGIQIAWANRLLGRREKERDALEQIARGEADTIGRLEAEARIAVLLADTAQGARIDTILAEQSNRPMRDPLGSSYGDPGPGLTSPPASVAGNEPSPSSGMRALGVCSIWAPGTPFMTTCCSCRSETIRPSTR